MLKSCFLLARTLLLVITLSLTAGASALVRPSVVKVEPPNWWAGHSINPVRLLIRGENLQGVQVKTPPELQVGLTSVNAQGTYLFVDVLIPPETRPGQYPLALESHAGSAVAPFEVIPRLDRGGRFSGFDHNDVIYLLMPDRFSNGDPGNDDPVQSRGLLDRSKGRHYHGGDFKGVIERLPYLKDLGVTAIWMNPVYDNVNHLNRIETYHNQAITDYHGYGAVDFYAVDEHLGTLDQLRKLVDAAHAQGIKVIQDQVANHTGPYHPWVEDSPTPTWYNGSQTDHIPNNWQVWTLADPHSAESVRQPTLDGWFLDILPDLNQDDPETARYLIQNAVWWIGVTGFDGIRQDTLPYVPRKFWNQWRSALQREFPDLTVVGEMWDGNPALLSFFQGGRARYDGIDSRIEALFDFPFYFRLRSAFLNQSPLREVAKLVAHDRLYVDPQKLVTFVGLHDVPRFMGEAGADFTGSKLAHALIFTSRGIPVLYYGDEIGLAGGGDPDNRRDFPGGWSSDPKNKFTPAGRTDQENDLFDFIRHLAHVRADLPSLRQGDMVNLLVEEQQWVFARRTSSETAVVAFNNDPAPARLEIDASATRYPEGCELTDRLGGITGTRVEGGKIRLNLPGRTAAILAPRRY